MRCVGGYDRTVEGGDLHTVSLPAVNTRPLHTHRISAEGAVDRCGAVDAVDQDKLSVLLGGERREQARLAGVLLVGAGGASVGRVWISACTCALACARLGPWANKQAVCARGNLKQSGSRSNSLEGSQERRLEVLGVGVALDLEHHQGLVVQGDDADGVL